jgi:hypothetical protein
VVANFVYFCLCSILEKYFVGHISVSWHFVYLSCLEESFLLSLLRNMQSFNCCSSFYWAKISLWQLLSILYLSVLCFFSKIWTFWFCFFLIVLPCFCFSYLKIFVFHNIYPNSFYSLLWKLQFDLYSVFSLHPLCL